MRSGRGRRWSTLTSLVPILKRMGTNIEGSGPVRKPRKKRSFLDLTRRVEETKRLFRTNATLNVHYGVGANSTITGT